MALAQQSHDPELMAQISLTIEHNAATRQRVAFGRGKALGAETLAEILKAERKAVSYPRTDYEAHKHVVLIESQRPHFGFDSADVDDEDDDYDDGEGGEFVDDEDFEAWDDAPPPRAMPNGVPARALPILDKILDRYGELPDPNQVIRENPDLAIELMDVLQGMKVPPEMLDALKEIIRQGAAPRPPRGRRRRR